MAVMLHSFDRYDYGNRDMVYYNDQVKEIQAEYGDGVDIGEIERSHRCEIFLEDDPEYDSKLIRSYGENALVIDFNVGESVGKICFPDQKDAFTEAKNSVVRGTILIWVFVLFAGYILMLILYFYFIRPFWELQRFAQQVAKGNLDIRLPIHRGNMFGAFTESFDLLREELAGSREREAEAERSKKELVAQLSHDIKTPVSTIKATCEVLEMKERMEQNENPGSDDMLEKIGYISKKADTIDSLISNLFHATLEELEVLEVNPVETDSRILKDLFDGVMVDDTILLKNPVPECLVYMDPLRMEQVIGNVIQNSYKYAGTKIEVSFRMTDEGDHSSRKMDDVVYSDWQEDRRLTVGTGNPGGYLQITIRDYGKGIEEEDRYKVTEKYYRGSNASGKQGSGLGLYLAKFFMEKQMGGFDCYNAQEGEITYLNDGEQAVATEGAEDRAGGFVVELYLRKV